MNGISWKTTLAGLVAAVAFLLGHVFKIDVPTEVTDGIVAVALFVGGLIQKDKDVTGTGSTAQTK